MSGMKLIFLYGPAASGKLTIARELSRLTGIPVFHNHLVVDAVSALFEFGSEPFVRLRETMWLDAFTEAAKAGTTFIFTFAPESTVRPEFIGRTIQAIEQEGGEVVFIRLTCSPEDQEKRIADESRRAFGKLRSGEMLRQLRRNNFDKFPPLPDSGLAIDTSRTPAEESARIIWDFLNSM